MTYLIPLAYASLGTISSVASIASSVFSITAQAVGNWTPATASYEMQTERLIAKLEEEIAEQKTLVSGAQRELSEAKDTLRIAQVKRKEQGHKLSEILQFQCRKIERLSDDISSEQITVSDDYFEEQGNAVFLRTENISGIFKTFLADKAERRGSYVTESKVYEKLKTSVKRYHQELLNKQDLCDEVKRELTKREQLLHSIKGYQDPTIDEETEVSYAMVVPPPYLPPSEYQPTAVYTDPPSAPPICSIGLK